MSSKLKLSEKTSQELDFLSSSLDLRRNIICRMALGISLNALEPPEIVAEDSLGQEFNRPTILGVDDSLFSILVSQHYGKKIPEDDMFSKYMRAEISNGIHTLYRHYKKVNSPSQFFEDLCLYRGEFDIESPS